VLDQIEEAIKYIKSLELKLKKDEEKKERFTRRSSSSSYMAPTRSRNRNGPEGTIYVSGGVESGMNLSYKGVKISPL